MEVEFGYAVFQADDGRYGVKNKNGEEVVPACNRYLCTNKFQKLAM